MPAHPSIKHAMGAVSAALAVVLLAACGNTVSTSSFKGAEHEVAQTISNFQADATAGEQKKICTEDLSSTVVERLKGKKGCEDAIKKQLTEVDSYELSIQSIKIGAGGSSATATVKATREGKKRLETLALVHEQGKWKISGL